MLENDLDVISTLKIDYDFSIYPRDRKIFIDILNKYLILIENCRKNIKRQNYILMLFNILDTKFGKIVMFKDIQLLTTIENKVESLIKEATLPELIKYLKKFKEIFN